MAAPQPERKGIFFILFIIVTIMFFGISVHATLRTHFLFLLALGMVTFLWTITYYLRRNILPLLSPMRFAMETLDLSIIDARLNAGRTSIRGFFGELLLMQEKKALEIKYQSGQFSIRRTGLTRKLTTMEQTIYNHLEEGLPTAFNQWTMAVATDAHSTQTLKLNETANTARRSLPSLFLSTSLGVFFSGIFVSLGISAFALMLIEKRYQRAGKRFPQTEDERLKLPLTEQRSVEREMTIIFILFTVVACSAYILSYWLLTPYWAAGVILIAITPLLVLTARTKTDENENTEEILSGLHRALKAYSQFHQQDNLNYFFIYGKYAAWSLVLNISSSKFLAEIEQIVMHPVKEQPATGAKTPLDIHPQRS